MRTLNRNKTVFYYALYEGKESVIDDYGNVTGEYEVKYSRPKKFRANISAANGKADVEQFGANVDYDKVIVGDNIFPQIDEYTIMWIDRSLNSVSIAVSKVEVSR